MTTHPIHGDTNVLRVADRIESAIALYRDGHTWEEVAQVCGYASRGAAHTAVMRYMREHAAAAAAELRAIENLRMDRDELRLRQIVEDRSAAPQVVIRAIEARTRLSARRARMNGLDAPVQVAVAAGSLAELDDALALLGDVVPGIVVKPDEPPEPE